jgi:hypothetical protein
MRHVTPSSGNIASSPKNCAITKGGTRKSKATSHRQAARAGRTDGPAAGPAEPKVTAPRAPNASDGADLAGPERVGGVDVVDEPAVMVPRLLAAAGARSAAGAPSKRLDTPWDGGPWSHCSVGWRPLEPLLRGKKAVRIHAKTSGAGGRGGARGAGRTFRRRAPRPPLPPAPGGRDMSS